MNVYGDRLKKLEKIREGFRIMNVDLGISHIKRVPRWRRRREGFGDFLGMADTDRH